MRIYRPIRAGLLLAPLLLAACGDDTDSASSDCAAACDAPPAAFCDGETFVAFAPSGECVSKECRYESVSFDCTAGCTPTGCVAEECDGQTCDAPPAAACDGNTALNYAPTGTCEDDRCTYAERAVDCTESGQECREGACVDPPDPCADVACDTPPEASCEDQTAITYAGGTCDEGECTYEPSRIDCTVEGEVCVEGACVEVVDLCEGVRCDVAPAASCDGNTAVTFSTPGTCAEGECSFVEMRTNCEDTTQICDAGACVDPVDLCEGVVCDEAPAAFCDGDGNRVTYPDAGTCVADDGSCDYIADVASCGTDSVCVDGACIAVVDPCEDVVCDSPPAASCAGRASITTYAATGTCVEELGSTVCTYEPTTADCASETPACDAGACHAVPTAGDLLITELLYDPDGDDLGQEWVELRNTADSVLLLRGTTVSWTSGSISFDERYINPGAYLVIEASASATAASDSVETSDLVLDNTSDFVEIAADGVTIDRVAYDEGELYPAAVGRSLALDPSTTANDVATNWCFGVDRYSVDTFSLGSPGATNPACDFECFDVECPVPSPSCDGDTRIVYAGAGTCVPEDGSCDYSAVEDPTNCADSSQVCVEGFCVTPPRTISEGAVIVNEFYASSTAADAWIELLNTTDAAINLEDFVVSGTDDNNFVLPAITVDAGGFVVLGADATSAGGDVDYAWGASSFSLDVDADTILLGFGETTVDRVDYGPADGWPLAADAATAFAGLPTDDNNNATFWCSSRVEYGDGFFGTPGAENDNCLDEVLPDPPDIGFGALVITEIMVDPDGVADEAAEWFEIYNVTGAPIDLRGLEIRSNNAEETFVIGRDGFFVDGRTPVLGSNSYLIIARSFTALGESTEATSRVGYVQTSMMLDNTNDTIAIYTRDTLVDSVSFTDGGGGGDPWPYAPGVAMALSDLSTAANQNDEWFTWCEAPTEAFYATFGGIQQRGTPGVQNGICGF